MDTMPPTRTTRPLQQLPPQYNGHRGITVFTLPCYTDGLTITATQHTSLITRAVIWKFVNGRIFEDRSAR